MIGLITNALKLTETVVRMIDKRRSRKTTKEIFKVIKQIKTMEKLSYEERIDSELDFLYCDLNILMLKLGKEIETAKHTG